MVKLKVSKSRQYAKIGTVSGLHADYSAHPRIPGHEPPPKRLRSLEASNPPKLTEATLLVIFLVVLVLLFLIIVVLVVLVLLHVVVRFVLVSIL